jgi:RNA ligase
MVHMEDLMGSGHFQKMLMEGYITVRPHHDHSELAIANYTPKAQYEWVWNEVTTQCRGLIFNVDTGEVVARPFAKFFNWDQGVGNETWQNKMPPTGPVVRMEKMDGSLGILYHVDSDGGDNHGHGNLIARRFSIATRGSFHSEQAEWATEFFRANYRFYPNPHKTYLFEIIYPENRIVVDYGDYKGLMLIDVIDNETGFADLAEFDNCNWPDKVSRTVLNHGFDSGQAAEIPKGDEGFVYLWPNINFRTKMKSADYIELHRLVSHLSEKTIWESLVAGKTKAQIKDGLPDEFHDFVDNTVSAIQDGAVGIVKQVAMEYEMVMDKINHSTDRKDFAMVASKSQNSKYLFAMLDGKGVYTMALQAMKPKSDKPLVDVSEDI